MFTLTNDPTFKHKVVARVPVDGGFRSDEFQATFRVIPVEEMAIYDLRDSVSSTEFLKRAVARLDDIADAGGNAVEYSDALRDQVFALPFARIALVRAYNDAVAGAALGN